MRRGGFLLRLLPFAIATVAVAGLVHIGTIFAYPNRAPDDAFARIAALGPTGTKIDLPPPVGGQLPWRDPAMASAVCRYDLAGGPFRIAVDALEESFLSLGMHSRHGVPFYGLNLRPGEGSRVDLVLMTDQQKADAEGADDQPPRQELRVVAPEAQGFVVIDTPLEGSGRGRTALDHVTCGAVATGGKEDAK